MIKNAAILAIGDEILLGQIQNTNSSWLSARLTSLGIKVESLEVCADDTGRIVEVLRRLSAEHDLIITTGGLGPTNDDKTVSALCTYFGVARKSDPNAEERISTRLHNIYKEAVTPELLELNLKQAEIPANSIALDNPQGAAPGIWALESEVYYLTLPGVPLEVKAIFDTSALPLLDKESPNNLQVYNIMVSGIPESALSMRLADFEEKLPADTSLAYLPGLAHIVLRLTKLGDTIGFEKICKNLRSEVGHYFIAEGDDLLLELMHLLHTKNLKITTAESCTGGGLASLICDVPGASEVFEESLISYANEVKMQKLSVPAETIATQGAVSEDTVKIMAETQLKNASADIAVAISGILGPGGGTTEKPVGTTYIGVATVENTTTHRINSRWNRANNKKHVIDSALLLLIQKLQSY